MESLLPAGIAAAAIGLTYFMCIRPMRRGHCAMTPQQSDASDAKRIEIDQLRAEIAELRRGQASQEAEGRRGESSLRPIASDPSRAPSESHAPSPNPPWRLLREDDRTIVRRRRRQPSGDEGSPRRWPLL